MTILLFGVSNVGKTVTGSILATKLGCNFFDLDEEVKKYYHTTLEAFVKTGTLESRDMKRGIVLDAIMREKADKVVAITPISHPVAFSRYLAMKDVLAIELRDTAENIFDRLVFSDENDNIYTDFEYKYAHMEHYISEIEADLSWYGSVYSNVKNKLDVNNDPPEIVADRIIEEFGLLQKTR